MSFSWMCSLMNAESQLLRQSRGTSSPREKRAARPHTLRHRSRKPLLELLEDRTLLSVSFAPAVSYSVGSYPQGVVTGDFRGDGKLDLAVANFHSNNVGVLLGNGDGTFQSQQTFATGGGPILLTTGDFNRDGKLDLAVTNYYDNTVSVLLGNGDGTFQSQQTFATGSNNQLDNAGGVKSDDNHDLKGDN